METLNQFLADIEHLTDTSSDGKQEYIHPSLKNLGSVSLVVIRETIAPTVFRNAEEEITDIEVGGSVHVRAVPNKFKYPEKGRGLQILRAYGVGGRHPQNRTALAEKHWPSEAFDLNTLVFGDSTTQGQRVLPVKAAVNYSDALSVLPKHLCVDETFHNRAAEDGTLFDPTDKGNSDNLFNRHFVLPGTLLVQVLSTRGKVLPPAGLDHLLLCIGLAGAYGGQTSITGTNIRSHLVGAYAAPFERPESSPYKLLEHLQGALAEAQLRDIEAVTQAAHDKLSAVHPTAVDSATLNTYSRQLIERFERHDETLEAQYKQVYERVKTLFDSWFENEKKKKTG